MATISVNGINFNILPETAAWSYAMNIKSFDTYDGRVVQLLSCTIESLSVEGYILPRRGQDPAGELLTDQWAPLLEFEDNVKAIMFAHEAGGRALQEGNTPSAHFSFPEAHWDGWVYLKGYSDVRYEPGVQAVRYKLSFEIDSGFETIQSAAGDYGLSNIPDGVGWVRSVYNTPNPARWEQVKTALENIVDDAGTHDASNPADFFQYIVEAIDGEKEKAEQADRDAKFVKGAKAYAKAAVDTTSILAQLGLVKNPVSTAANVVGTVVADSKNL